MHVFYAEINNPGVIPEMRKTSELPMLLSKLCNPELPKENSGISFQKSGAALQNLYNILSKVINNFTRVRTVWQNRNGLQSEIIH